MRWPPLSGGRVGWPKGVPRIAMLDDKTSSSGSRAANRRFLTSEFDFDPVDAKQGSADQVHFPLGCAAPRSRLLPPTAHCKRSTKPSLATLNRRLSAAPLSRRALSRSGHASVSKRKPAKLRRCFALGYARPAKLVLYSATEARGVPGTSRHSARNAAHCTRADHPGGLEGRRTGAEVNSTHPSPLPWMMSCAHNRKREQPS